MNRSFSLFFIFIFTNVTSFGQSESKSKTVFLEIAGSGGLGSFNYEQQFFKKEKIAYRWRVGFSLAPIDKNNGTGIVFPLMIHSLFGKTHLFELGLGQGITITTKGSYFILTTASVGYRLEPKNTNWSYRITYTPLISYLFDFQIQQWAGVSIGYTFKEKTK